MKPSPKSLQVLCVIGICWAVIGLLGGLGGMAMYFAPIGPPTPALIAMKKELWYPLMVFGMGGIALLLSALLLFGSLQALKLEKSGQRMLTAYAVAKLIESVIALTLNFVYILPRTMAATIPPGRPLPPGFDAIMRVSMYGGACIGIFFALAMPIYVLLVLRRQNVRDAFDGLYKAEGSFMVDVTPPSSS
jgi:hypothetical protein